MKAKYYTKHCSFRLPIFIVCCLLGACRKLHNKHITHCDSYKVCQPYMEVDEGYSSSSETIDYNLEFSNWLKQLFGEIGNDDINKVASLLNRLQSNDLDKMCEMDPENMSTCLHIAAEKTGTNAVAVMEHLLDKIKPLLLGKESRKSLFCQKDKLKAFVQNNLFWDENRLKDYLEYLAKNGSYNNSVLLYKNNIEETPLLIAMKRGTIKMLVCLLKHTHECLGLTLMDHIDEEGNDCLDIALKIALEQRDHHKLACLMHELCHCSDRSTASTCMHFSGMSKCQSEAVVQALISSKKKLKWLFKAVHHNRLEVVQELLDTIDTVLGPIALLKVLIKKCPCGPSGFTLIHTALDKNLLQQADMDTVEHLTERLSSTLKNVNSLSLSNPLKQQLKALLSQDANENLTENVSSLMSLAKDHKCESALLALEASLRILELETPPGQFWSLAHHWPGR